MFNFFKKKIKEIKEQVADPPVKIEFCEPSTPKEIFDDSKTLDEVLKRIENQKII